jgi:hypothetical protein
MTPSESADTRGRFEPFFVHVGSFVAVIVYFVVHGMASDPAEGVRIALPVALVVMSGYMWVARRRRLLKQFDFGLWSMFAVGTATVLGGCEGARFLFANYSVAILFCTLGLVAVVPPLVGREPFTVFFARRGTPAWQQKTRDFVIINWIITAWFAVLFAAAAARPGRLGPARPPLRLRLPESPRLRGRPALAALASPALPPALRPASAGDRGDGDPGHADDLRREGCGRRPRHDPVPRERIRRR